MSEIKELNKYSEMDISLLIGDFPQLEKKFSRYQKLKQDILMNRYEKPEVFSRIEEANSLYHQLENFRKFRNFEKKS
ncbi:MAG: hypothetical protein ISP71_08335 [Flavobacteriales bacterium]|nr:hypothetical protein [Flavobacteriales bacterium]